MSGLAPAHHGRGEINIDPELVAGQNVRRWVHFAPHASKKLVSAEVLLRIFTTGSSAVQRLKHRSVMHAGSERINHVDKSARLNCVAPEQRRHVTTAGVNRENRRPALRGFRAGRVPARDFERAAFELNGDRLRPCGLLQRGRTARAATLTLGKALRFTEARSSEGSSNQRVPDRDYR